MASGKGKAFGHGLVGAGDGEVHRQLNTGGITNGADGDAHLDSGDRTGL